MEKWKQPVSSKMILNFDEFQKANQTGGDLDNIRIKNFNIFQKKGFPSKKEENWKYTDLKTILHNNLNNLEVLNNKKTFPVLSIPNTEIISGAHANGGTGL